MIKNYAQNDDGDNNSRYDNFDFSLDMQFDTIKVSSFYRDHGVLGCIDNLRNVFLFSINNSLTFRNHVVFGRLQSSYHSFCLRVLIGMQLRTNVQGLDGFSNLSEFQFEGNWRWVLYIFEYSCSLQFSDNTLLVTFSH